MGLLQQVKTAVGKMLRPVHAGTDKLLCRQDAVLAPSSIEVSSPAFSNGARLPRRFTTDGDNVSPPIEWKTLPPGTRELVLICEDPDAPFPRPFVHWIAYRIAPERGSIPECLHMGSQPVGLGGLRQGRNSMRKDGFAGAAPPPGHGPHRYFFQLFALDAAVEPGERPDRDDMLRAMKGHVLANGVLVATYER